MPRTRRYGKKWRLEPCWRVRDTAAFLTTVDFFHDLRGLRHLQLTFYALRPTAPMNCEPHKLTGPCIILRRQLNVEKIPIGPLPPSRHPAIPAIPAIPHPAIPAIPAIPAVPVPCIILRHQLKNTVDTGPRIILSMVSVDQLYYVLIIRIILYHV